MKLKIWNKKNASVSANWRNAEPKPQYDVIIIGGGGHGLAAAYELAKNYGMTNIAVLASDAIGDGICDSAVVRANDIGDPCLEFYSHNLKLWQSLHKKIAREMKLNACGVMDLCHSPEQFDFFARRGNVIRAQGDAALLCDYGMVRDLVPNLHSDNPRLRVYGGLWQKSAGIVNPLALAMHYANAADALGVDLISNCDVTGLIVEGGVIKGVETVRGKIMADKVALASNGNTTRLVEMAGLKLPIVNHETQRLVSEAVKPILNCVVKSGLVDVQIHQSKTGALILSGDVQNAEQLAETVMEMFPKFGAAKIVRRKLDITEKTPDGAPIIDKTPIEGLYLNGGWIDGGLDALPASGVSLACLIATGRPSECAQTIRLDRFDRN